MHAEHDWDSWWVALSFHLAHLEKLEKKSTYIFVSELFPDLHLLLLKARFVDNAVVVSEFVLNRVKNGEDDLALGQDAQLHCFLEQASFPLRKTYLK